MSDKPRRNVSSLEKRNGEIIKSAEPQLDGGQSVRALFMGQTRISPFWEVVLFPIFILLIPVYVVVWLLGRVIPPLASWLPQKRVILVTDREVYYFSKQGGRFGVKDLLHGARLGEIRAEQGFPWSLKLGDWPRLYASELGIRGERAKVADLVNRAR